MTYTSRDWRNNSFSHAISFPSTERSTALFYRCIRQSHQDHTPLITHTLYEPTAWSKRWSPHTSFYSSPHPLTPSPPHTHSFFLPLCGTCHGDKEATCDHLALAKSRNFLVNLCYLCVSQGGIVGHTPSHAHTLTLSHTQLHMAHTQCTHTHTHSLAHTHTTSFLWQRRHLPPPFFLYSTSAAI